MHQKVIRKANFSFLQKNLELIQNEMVFCETNACILSESLVQNDANWMKSIPKSAKTKPDLSLLNNYYYKRYIQFGLKKFFVNSTFNINTIFPEFLLFLIFDVSSKGFYPVRYLLFDFYVHSCQHINGNFHRELVQCYLHVLHTRSKYVFT